jgi:DNA-directed RNA polymerase subunit RPC12/RpoP
MSDFEFNCPHCEQTLEAPEDMLGQTIECPACNGSIDLPAPEPEPEPPPRPAPKKKIVTKRRTGLSTSSSNTKPCPYCGESILSVAVKCKHCGSQLTGGTAPTVQKSEAIGVIALILPICSAMIAWFWLSGMPLLFDPGSKLAMISIITIIATSILVAIEANTVGAGSKTDLNAKGKKREGPVTWFFGCILLWIVAFPAWMARRSKYGLKNLCFAAILVGLIFAGVTGFMHYAIEDVKSQARQQINDAQRELERAQRELENIWNQ